MNELQNQLDQGLEELGAREDRGQYNLSGSRPKRSQSDPNGGEDEEIVEVMDFSKNVNNIVEKEYEDDDLDYDQDDPGPSDAYYG